MNTTEVRLVRRPKGRAGPGDFALHDTPLPTPGAGEVLVEVAWLSIDPYLNERAIGDRVGPAVPVGSCMVGRGIGRVLAGPLPEGALVAGELGWRSHAVVAADSLAEVPAGNDGLEPTWSLGVLGVPGLTAWISLFQLGAAKRGQTVLVSSAAGTVGSIAAQLARDAGLRVVGITSGAQKCHWLRELGVIPVDRKAARGLAAELAEALAGNGFDLMLDHAGATVLQAALQHARPRARIVLSGHVGGYGTAPAMVDADLVLYQRLSLHGFLVHDYPDLFDTARRDLAAKACAGRIVVRETVHEGLASAPSALQALLDGHGIGKHLVRLDHVPS